MPEVKGRSLHFKDLGVRGQGLIFLTVDINFFAFLHLLGHKLAH